MGVALRRNRVDWPLESIAAKHVAMLNDGSRAGLY
jgi:hypothetical protein